MVFEQRYIRVKIVGFTLFILVFSKVTKTYVTPLYDYIALITGSAVLWYYSILAFQNKAILASMSQDFS